MKRVGKVVRIAQGLAVVRSPDGSYPEIGTMVIDEDLEPVGRIVDVFGPVSRPYIALTPDDDVRLPLLLGKAIYAR